jgi:L-glyceraldehyde 3-phosphate reductase
LKKVQQLHDIALQRGQSLSQMAIAWLMRSKVITSVLIGVSSVQQLDANLGTLDNLHFEEDELTRIEKVLIQ